MIFVDGLLIAATAPQKTRKRYKRYSELATDLCAELELAEAESGIDSFNLEQLQETTDNVLQRLMHGSSIGTIMDFFNSSDSEIAEEFSKEVAIELSSELKQAQTSRGLDSIDLELLRKTAKEVRNYIVLGDPAVRLMVRETLDEKQ